MQDHLWFQMFAIFIPSIFMILAGNSIKARPSNFDKQVDNFNEVKLLIIMYHIVLFTNFVPDIETKD